MRSYYFDIEVTGRMVGNVEASNKKEAMEKILGFSRDVDWIHYEFDEVKPKKAVR